MYGRRIKIRDIVIVLRLAAGKEDKLEMQTGRGIS